MPSLFNFFPWDKHVHLKFLHASHGGRLRSQTYILCNLLSILFLAVLKCTCWSAVTLIPVYIFLIQQLSKQTASEQVPNQADSRKVCTTRGQNWTDQPFETVPTDPMLNNASKISGRLPGNKLSSKLKWTLIFSLLRFAHVGTLYFFISLTGRSTVLLAQVSSCSDIAKQDSV